MIAPPLKNGVTRVTGVTTNYNHLILLNFLTVTLDHGSTYTKCNAAMMCNSRRHLTLATTLLDECAHACGPDLACEYLTDKRRWLSTKI